MSDLPNVVLVHGAWADGSSWSSVGQQLQAEGVSVTAPQFPETDHRSRASRRVKHAPVTLRPVQGNWRDLSLRRRVEWATT
jgi:hypothetical protein